MRGTAHGPSTQAHPEAEVLATRERRRSCWIRGTAAFMALGLTAAACSGDDSTGSAGGTGDNAAMPPGEPIKVLLAWPLTQPTEADFTAVSHAAEAHAAALNSEGGIAGRPIEVLVCDTQLDPVQEVDCMRQAVDENVAAVLGFNALGTADSLALLEEAGIPAIGTVPTDQASVTSPISFPLTSGPVSQIAAAPAALERSEATQVSLMIPDVAGPAIAQLEGLWNSTVDAAGVDNQGLVRVPLGSTDLSPVVASATAAGVDGVAVAIPGDTALRVVQSMQQQHPGTALVLVDVPQTDAFLSEVGSAAEGAVVVASLPPTSATDVAGIDQLLNEMETFAPSDEIVDDAINTWLATYVFGLMAAQVAADGGTIDGAAILAELETQTELDTLGLTPTLDFTEPFTTLPGRDRLFNPAVVLTTVEDGQFVMADPDDPFIDPFADSGGSDGGQS